MARDVGGRFVRLILAFTIARVSASSPRAASTMCVGKNDGQATVTATSRGSSSARSVSDSAITPAFETLYGANLERHANPAAEAMFNIQPRRRARIAGTNA